VSNQDAGESITPKAYASVIISEHSAVGLDEVDEALATLCRMVTRAVGAYDLPNVKHFLERIDEVLEARFTFTRDLQPQGAPCTPST